MSSLLFFQTLVALGLFVGFLFGRGPDSVCGEMTAIACCSLHFLLSAGQNLTLAMSNVLGVTRVHQQNRLKPAAELGPPTEARVNSLLEVFS